VPFIHAPPVPSQAGATAVAAAVSASGKPLARDDLPAASRRSQ